MKPTLIKLANNILSEKPEDCEGIDNYAIKLKYIVKDLLYYIDRLEIRFSKLQKQVTRSLKKEKLYSENNIAKAIATSDRFSYTSNLIVPNVYWGWKLRHEADLIVITSSRYAHEIEIKTSLADLKKDKEKRVFHSDPLERLRYLWYAGPITLKDAFEKHCPENAGIILVEWDETKTKWKVEEHRQPKPNQNAKKISLAHYSKLARLGAMRYWSR